MKPKKIIYGVFATLISSMMISCSSTNQFASSFGKRKYMKGYYFNLPSSSRGVVVASNNAAPVAIESKTNDAQPAVIANNANTNRSKDRRVGLKTNYGQAANTISASHIEIKSVKHKTVNAIVNSNMKKGKEATIAVNRSAITDNSDGIANTTGGGNSKSWIVALLLCIFLGALGIHRFYLGYIGLGILELFTGGVLGILWLIDLVRIIIKDLKPNGGDYTD